MAYSGETAFEHVVPFTEEVAERAHAFYANIGWVTMLAEGGHMLRAVPDFGDEAVDGIGYWHYEDRPHRDIWYGDYIEPGSALLLDGSVKKLSPYTLGTRLAGVMDLIECKLVLPSDDHLSALIEDGGELLDNHIWVPRRKHAGNDEIRFVDPFMLSVRVTTKESDRIKPMIEQDVQIESGTIVRHRDGLLYRVKETIPSTIDLEEGGTLEGSVVKYEQLVDGKFPAGSLWAKDEAGFRRYFSIAEDAA